MKTFITKNEITFVMFLGYLNCAWVIQLYQITKNLNSPT